MRSNRIASIAPVRSQLSVFVVLLVACLSTSPVAVMGLRAQDDKSADSSEVKAPDEKVLRYHKALQRRPVPGYLFDRFYNTWLDGSSTNELKKFLVKQADESNKTADRLLLAFFYAKQEEDALAIEQFRLALKNDPGNADVLYEKAVVEARTLDFENALKDLDAALSLSPKPETQIKIGKLQGTLHARNLENEKAVEVWNKMIATNQDDEALKEDLIDLQIREGMQKQALELLEKLIAQTKDPYKKVMRSLRKGDIYQRTGDREKALAVYDSTLEQVGMNSWIEREILAQIGQVYRKEDDLTGLAEHYAKLVETNSKRIALRKVHAKTLMQIGNSEEAIEASKKIVELTPGDRSNRESLIDLLTAGEQYDQAVKQTEALISQFPKDAELFIRLASVHRLQEKMDEAAKAMTQYLDAAEKTEYAFLRTGRLLEKYKLKDKAKSVFEECLKAFPDSGSAKESYALFLFQNSEKEKAIDIWSKLAEGGDKNQVIRVARIFASRQLHQNAFDLLKERLDDFGTDPIYLGQLCLEADALKKHEEALPWAIKRVELSKDAVALELCMGQTVRTIEKAKQAAEQINKIAADTDASISMRCLQAELLSRTGQSNQAEDNLKTWIEQVAKNESLDLKSRTTALQMLGQQRIRIYSNQFDWTSAAQAAQELVELPGGNTAFNLKRLVELLVRSGQQETALEWTTRWKKAAPNSSAPWMRESGIMVTIGKAKESVEVLRNATRKFPDEPDLFVELAERYSYIDQYDDAERIYWIQYEEAESLADKLRWAERLGQHFYYYGDESELVKNFEERRRNNPTSIDPILALAQIHRILENYEERRDALAEALRLQPENIQLIHELAQTEETEGEWEAALTTLQSAVKLDKTYRTRQKIAAIYFKYDELQKGLDILAEIAGGLNAAPRDIEKIVDAIVQNDEWQIALDFILPHVARHPNDYRLRYQLGVIQEELELFEPARQTFLDLLRVDQEITGLKKSQANAGYYGGFMDEIEEFLPPQASEVWTIMQATELAYSHRENRHSHYSHRYYGYSASASQISLPESLQEMRSLTANHLINLLIEAPDSARENTLDIMKNRGVQEAHLLWAILSESSFDDLFENGPDVFAALLENHGDNKTMLALFTFLATNGVEFEESKETLEKAFKLFKEDYPSLAFINGSQLVVLGKKDEDFNADFVAVGKQIKKPSRMHFQILYSLLQFDGKESGPFNRGQQKYDLDSNVKKELGPILEKWVTDIRRDDTSYYLFRYISEYFLTQKTPEEYIKMLDEEVVRHQAEQKNQSASRWSGYYGYVDPDEDALSFPPELNSFPNTVASLFEPGEDADYNYLLDEPADLDEPGEYDFTKRFADKLGSVQNPLLKLLFEFKLAYYQSIDADEPEKAFASVIENAKKLVDADPSNLDAILLSASIANYLDNYTTVDLLLSKTNSLPLDRMMRQKIDSAFLLNAFRFEEQQDLESEAGKTIVANAKIAIKRMLRANLSADRRMSLIRSMSRLGLDEEVENLASRTNQMPGNANLGGYPFASSFSSPSSSSGLSRVNKFMEEGKKDVAIRTLAQQIRPIAKMMTTVDTAYDVDSETLLEFKRTIHVFGLEQELLDYLANSESRSGKIVHAAVHQMIDRDEKAAELYRKLLAEYPREDGVRFQFLRLLSRSDPKAFFEGFGEIEEDKQEPFLMIVAIAFSGPESYLPNPVDQEEMVDWAEAICEMIEKAAPEKRVAFAKLADAILEYFDVSDDYFKTYFQLNDADDSDQADTAKLTDQQKQLKKKRLEVHERLCRLMIQHFNSSSAFAELLAAHKSHTDEVDTAKIQNYAVEIIKNTPPPKKSSRQRPSSPYRSARAYSRSKGYPMRYSRRSARTDNPKSYVEKNLIAEVTPENKKTTQDFIQHLRGKNNTELADQLERLTTLYWADESDYQKTAEAFLTSSVKSSRDTDGLATAMDKVLEVWGKRKLKVDLFEMVDKHQKEIWKKTRRSSGMNNEIGLAYIRELTKRGELKRAESILNDYVVHIFGGTDKITSTLKSQLKLMRRGTGGRQLMQYAELVRDLLRSEYLFWIGLNQIAAHPEISEVFSSDYVLEQKLESLENEEEIDNFLRRSPFSVGLDEFDPIYSKEMSLPFLSSFMPSRYRYLDSISILKEHAMKIEDQTFGKQVWKALMTESDRIGALVKLIGKHLETFKKLTPERQKAVAMFVFMHTDDELYEAFKPEELEGDAKQAFSLLKKHVAEQVVASLEDSGDDKNADYFSGSDSSSPSEQLGKLLDFFEVKAALEICKKVLKPDDDKGRREFDRFDPYGSYSPVNSMILENCNYFRINLMLEILKSPDFSVFALEHYSINSFLSGRIDALTDSENPVDGFKAFYEEFGAKLEGRDPAGLLSVMTPLVSERFPVYPDEPETGGDAAKKNVENEKYLAEVAAWSKNEMKSGKYPALARTIWQASRLAIANPDPDNNLLNVKRPKPNQVLADYQKDLFDRLNDEKLSDNLRVNLALFIGLDPTLPTENVFECVNIVLDKMTKNNMSDFRVLLAFMLNRPDKENEKWKEVANRWWKTSGGHSDWMDRADQYELVHIVPVLAALEKQSAINSVIQEQAYEMADNRILLSLLDAGLLRQARRVLEYQIESDLEHAEPAIFYTKSVHEKLPALLSQFNDQQMKLAVELYFATFKDPKEAAEQAPVKRSERLKSIANRYLSIPQKSEPLRRHLLAILSQEADCYPIVKDSLESTAKKITPLVIWSGNRSSGEGFEKNREMLVSQSIARLNARTPDPFQYLTSVVEREHPDFITYLKNEYSSQYLFRRFGALVGAAYSKADNETKKYIYEELMSFVKKQPMFCANDSVVTVLFVGAIANKQVEQLNELKKSIEESEKELDPSDYRPPSWQFTLDSIWGTLTKMSPEISQGSIEERLQTTQMIWQSAKDLNASVGTGDFRNGIRDGCDSCRVNPMGLEEIVRAKLLTEKEMAEQGMKLAEINSVDGEVWRQVAKYQAKFNMHDQAAESFGKAMKATPKKLDQAKANRTVEYAHALVEIGKLEEAKKLLKSVDRSQLIRDNIGRFEKMKADLNISGNESDQPNNATKNDSDQKVSLFRAGDWNKRRMQVSLGLSLPV